MRAFLPCVSSEFWSYRLRLAAQMEQLPRQHFEFKVQKDFEQGGFTLVDRFARLRSKRRTPLYA